MPFAGASNAIHGPHFQCQNEMAIVLSQKASSWWRSLSYQRQFGSRMGGELVSTNSVSNAAPFFIPRSSVANVDSSRIMSMNTVMNSTHERGRKRKYRSSNCTCDDMRCAVYIPGCNTAMPVIVLSRSLSSLSHVIARGTEMPHVIHLLASRTHDVASGNHMERSGSFSCLRDTLAYLLGQSVLALDEELQACTKFLSKPADLCK